MFHIMHFRRLRSLVSETTTSMNTTRVCATMLLPYWSMYDCLMAVVAVKRSWPMRTLILTWASCRHCVHLMGTAVMRATDHFMRQWNQHCRTSLSFPHPSSYLTTPTLLYFQLRCNLKIGSDCFQLTELPYSEDNVHEERQWLQIYDVKYIFKWQYLEKINGFCHSSRPYRRRTLSWNPHSFTCFKISVSES